MRVVSNTSPLSNLAIVDRLPLLRGRYGQRVVGILGVLVWAKDHGLIESVTAEMVRLVAEARFFIHPALQAYVRKEVGEE